MTILAENWRLRLKVMLRGPKLLVNSILNAIGVCLRSIGTHFDHNRYIIRIFIFLFFVFWFCFVLFLFFYTSLWSNAKVSDPLYRGFPDFLFINVNFNLLLVTPSLFFFFFFFGKKLNQNFPIYHPSLLLEPSRVVTRCQLYTVTLFVLKSV